MHPHVVVYAIINVMLIPSVQLQKTEISPPQYADSWYLANFFSFGKPSPTLQVIAGTLELSDPIRSMVDDA